MRIKRIRGAGVCFHLAPKLADLEAFRHSLPIFLQAILAVDTLLGRCVVFRGSHLGIIGQECAFRCYSSLCGLSEPPS